ncbi:hypothetical protein SAMN05444392_11668 [Seinonella peptonophila]|uniref:Uncharacterized protein n=1 Tax=Seinonella peptonophila TaxID=112248 RepID=A0A1M5AY06_9BACL|nr:hypothetical protein [Seinonella peptonophila]SHF35105.1 hypothetical protein SAMN05444392_11668 [Seinonella peptonophila]
MSSIEGWIKLYRKILLSDLYRSLNAKQKIVFFTLLLMVNHQSRRWEYQGEIYRLQPGQVVTSLAKIRAMSADCEVSIQTVRTTLLKLEKWGFLTNQSTKKNRLITLVNWEFYQGDREESTKKLTNNQQSTNKELANHQQSDNKELITNKNEENVKNDKNEENEKNRHLCSSTHSKQTWFERIEQHYLKRRGKGMDLTTKDIQAIHSLLNEGFTLNDVIEGIDYAFNRFQPKHKKDEIQSFRYCEKVIHDLAAKRDWKTRGGLRNEEDPSIDSAYGKNDPIEVDFQNSYYAGVIADECLE